MANQPLPQTFVYLAGPRLAGRSSSGAGQGEEITIGTGLQLTSSTLTCTVSGGVSDHGGLTGLSDDDHTQYATVGGRATPQTIAFGTASGATAGYLTSTAHATKGKYGLNAAGTIVVDEANVRIGVATATPSAALHVVGRSRLDSSTVPILDFYDGATYKGSVGISVYGNDVVVSTPANSMVLRQAGGGFVFGDSSATEIFRIANSGAVTATSTVAIGTYTVATLPTAGTARRLAFASNGRKNGEGAGAGTGVVVFDDGTAWRAVDTGATVAA